VIFEDGEQTRDFVHVSDIVQANLLALESNRADYNAINVGTGVPTSVRTVAALVSGWIGKRISNRRSLRSIARAIFVIA
jgi:dTDP-L-rhamnose 4-epimerase